MSSAWLRPPAYVGSPGFRLRDVGLTLAVLGVCIAVFLLSAVGADQLPWAPMLPLGLVAGGVAAWLVLEAIYGSPVAIMLYFAAIAFMTDAQFRVRGAGDISGDWQSALKFLIWLGAGVIGFAHMPPLRTVLSAARRRLLDGLHRRGAGIERLLAGAGLIASAVLWRCCACSPSPIR